MSCPTTSPLWTAIKLKVMLKKLTIFFSFLLLAFAGFAQNLPPKPSNSLILDSTNTLSPIERQALEDKLVAYNDSTTTQIAVVILHNVQGDDINDFGQKLGRAWGIGQKGKNNGLLVLVALDEHKVSIQTGYGAEGAVPDIVTQQIIQNDILPNFRQKNYYAGLDAATTSLMRYMKGEYKAAPGAGHRQKDKGGIGSAFVLIFIVIIILIVIFRGRGGGGGRIYDSRGGASPFWWFLAGSALGRGSGGWGGFSGGGGGDSGGFGGFGGGDFGGGGSSGSW
jgi:uncharacterized protein